MTIKPVETVPAPGYPDKYAEESRQALAAARPRRWVAAPIAAGLAATVALGLSGCGDAFVTGGEPVQTPMETETCTTSGTDYVVMGELPVPVDDPPPISADAVIPLFEYGEGIGSFGCVSVAAPYFMSEDEAFAILSAAFAEAGVMLRKNSKTRQATLPVTIINEYDDKAPKTKEGKLKPDALANGVPVEFVSREDVETWEYKAVGPIYSGSSVDSYQMKGAAQTLAKNNPGLVVFYDPVAHVYHRETLDEMAEEYGWYKTEQEARAQSERQLREQVQAFIEWLSTQGAR